ncbi:HPr kinase/phosphorylase [Zavarzinia sp. CC-PAN008]|uniref:HPr kinase/phosphorylase n=1 Tax=Zavarzinia sp. CC-PAN008 TaxID=3243332 RepID=UPI003F744D77
MLRRSLPGMILVHGTCIELAGTAVLLRGPSGSGKSDLALRLIDTGAALIADDQVALERREGGIFARSPAVIAGMMEVRGLGLVGVPTQAVARLGLVVDLVSPDEVERMPEVRSVDLLGWPVPACDLAPFEASAAAKVRMAVRCLNQPTRLD